MGAVAGLFCVDLRKSSYLGEQWNKGPALRLCLVANFIKSLLRDFTWIISYVLKIVPSDVTQ